MLKYIVLTNFRGFRRHRIEFLSQSILVGRNNAGKTTTIEALRIVSVCQIRAKSAIFTPRPAWLDGVCDGAGFTFSLDTIDFDFSNVQHAYDSETPAIIVARLKNNNEISIYVGSNSTQVFCQVRDRSKNIITNRTDMSKTDIGHIKVMPPIGSLIPNERLIAKDRLRRFMDGYIAYRHFRNQLWELSSEYRSFKKMLEDTWGGLQIQSFENDHGPDRNEFSLLIREGKFTSEICWHGHGLQAWAQAIWFLSRTPPSATIVLDEPDVYLHAELQRKLIKVIESIGFSQNIIATHSSEIISDVPFRNVIVIQKKESISRSAVHADEIQKSLRLMGSIHSIQLSKLAEKGLVLFTEGDDDKFLSEISFKIGVLQYDRFSKIAIYPTNGKGNWLQTLGSANTLVESSGGDIKAAILLDRDYMTDEQKVDFERRVINPNIILKIWNRKEIENYFISASAISRYINRNSDRDTPVLEADVDEIIDEIAIRNEGEILSSFAECERPQNRTASVKTLMRSAKLTVDSRIAGGFRLIDLMSGKDAFSQLSTLCHERYGVSFSPLAICKELRRNEVPDEMSEFVIKVCELSEKA